MQYGSLLVIAAINLLNLNEGANLGQKNKRLCRVLCTTAFASQVVRVAVVTPASIIALKLALGKLKSARDALTDFVYTVKLRRHLISLMSVLDEARAKEVNPREQQKFVSNFHFPLCLTLPSPLLLPPPAMCS